MKSKCEGCNHYRKIYETTRNRIVHTCEKHKNFTVYGELLTTVNPECVNGDFFAWNKIMSLRDLTFKVAGGAYDRKTEKERSGCVVTDYKNLKRSGWTGK